MLELIPFTEEDCDRLIGWVPDARFLMLWAGPGYTWPLDGKQLLKALERTRSFRPVFFMFKAVETESGRVIGHIELQRYERGAAHIARVLIGDPACRGKGYGAQLVRLLVEFAFIELGLDLLSLNVYDCNTAAIGCYERLGFERVDCRQEVRMVGDEVWRLLSMELKREDWEKGGGSENLI